MAATAAPVTVGLLELGGCEDSETAVILDGSASADDASVDTSVARESDDAADDASLHSGPYPFFFEEVKLDSHPLAVTELRFIPGTDNEFFVLEKDGRVIHYRLDGDTATGLGSFTLPVSAAADCGLLSMAFDPDFVRNKVVYFGYCITPTHNRISRHVFDPSNYASTIAGDEVITVGDDAAKEPWHNVGSMGFDADGNLWAVFGEKDMGDPAQDAATALGSLVRVRPNPDGGYAVPASNPYAGDPTKAGAIYAKGLRSPWRATLDSRGRWFVGDVGSSRFEEVDMVTGPGQNFGWPLHEGDCTPDCGATLPPLVVWDRTVTHRLALEDPNTPQNSRRVVWVGSEYRDRGNDRYKGRLTGRVLYGEFCSGWVRAIGVPTDGGKSDDSLLAHLESITSWDQAPDGHLYTVTYGSCNAFPYMAGQLWRLKMK